MKRILTLRQQDITPGSPEVDSSDFYKRSAARAVVHDENGLVTLMFARTRNYYKLPGGGIEAGEDIIDALRRELLEELGCEVDNISEIGEVVEYRDVEQMLQTSYCFRARVIGVKGEPTFTDSELADGFKVTWHESIDAAIKAIIETEPIGEYESIAFMRRREVAILEAAKTA